MHSLPPSLTLTLHLRRTKKDFRERCQENFKGAKLKEESRAAVLKREAFRRTYVCGAQKAPTHISTTTYVCECVCV